MGGSYGREFVETVPGRQRLLVSPDLTWLRSKAESLLVGKSWSVDGDRECEPRASG